MILHTSLLFISLLLNRWKCIWLVDLTCLIWLFNLLPTNMVPCKQPRKVSHVEGERGLIWRTVNGSILGVLSRLEGSEFETRHTTASTTTLELSPEATKNAYTLRHMKKASVVILAVFIGNSPAACAIVVLLCGNHVTFSLRSQSWKK